MYDLVALRRIGDSVGTMEVGARFRAEGPHAQELIRAGAARLDTGYTWDGLTWPGETVVVIGGGESVRPEDFTAIGVWRARGGPRRVIAINNAYQQARYADVLYACDAPWWRLHYVDVIASGFEGELWTQDKKALELGALKHVQSLPRPGLGRFPGVIHQGANGGYQGVNLAYQAGAKRILLVGFDMQGGHWHGDHPKPLTNPTPSLFNVWVHNFVRLAEDLCDEGIDVINCSRVSRLTCFPRRPLEECLT